MAAEKVIVPSPGESVSEGRIAQWYKQDGEAVQVDDPLFELESDKAAQTINAQVAGVLKVLVPEGEMVEVGAEVAEIDPDGKPKESSDKKSEGDDKEKSDKSEPSSKQSEKKKDRPTEDDEDHEEEAEGESRISPAARRVLADAGVEPAKVRGTGPGGLITKEDALAYTKKSDDSRNGTPEKAGSEKPKPKPEGRETRQPMSMIRKRIAQRLLESQNNTATLTTFNEADMTGIMELRAKYNDKFEKQYGVKLGFMSIFVKAAIEALKKFPLVNARIDGGDVVYQHFYDIGVAVSTEKGLMVPVVRDADQLGFADIEKTISAVAKKARDGKVSLDDLQGGTFTITNGGIFGSMLSTPILNPPQTAILGMHAIQKRPVAINDQVVIRPMMYLALSYDHRIIDGKEAVQFLVRIKECVENPERMLLEV